MAHPAERYQSPRELVTVSHLLKQLELVGDDVGQFDAILRKISQASSQSPWLKAAGGVSMAVLFLVIPRRRRFFQMAAVLVLSLSGLSMLSGCSSGHILAAQ